MPTLRLVNLGDPAQRHDHIEAVTITERTGHGDRASELFEVFGRRFVSHPVDHDEGVSHSVRVRRLSARHFARAGQPIVDQRGVRQLRPSTARWASHISTICVTPCHTTTITPDALDRSDELEPRIVEHLRRLSGRCNGLQGAVAGVDADRRE